MAQVRDIRANYEAPSCSVSEAANSLGERQQSVISLLPARPNERLVYSCEPRATAGGSDLAASEE